MTEAATPTTPADGVENDDAVDGTAVPAIADGTRSLARRLLPAVLLLLIYGALSLVTSPHGYLGTDTGGKVLTLDAMEHRGSIDGLDVGYWAEKWDPEGDLHGYFGTVPGEGRWVQVTTVPMVLAARPLYDLGGYRLALLVPMLGGVAVALAGRSLARRFGATRRHADLAFWVVGLAGPVLIYSLDLWEHTLGLAAMAWALVATIDAARSDVHRRTVLLGLAAGVLWGVGYSMRTEALLYGAVVTAGYVLDRFVARKVATGLALGAGAAVGVVVGIGANLLLERAVLGDSLRAGRATGTAGGFGAELGTRVHEGLMTSFGTAANDAGIVLGLVAVLALALIVRRGLRPDVRFDGLRLGLVLLAVAPIILGLAGGLAFVPGLLIASPIAVAGLVLGGDARSATAVRAVVVAVPIVWLFQYLGGAGPQWGGRYLLLTSFVLTVAGISRFDRLAPVVSRGLVVCAALITLFGFAWMVQRTHGFADAGHRIAAVDEPVLIAKDGSGFLPREFVAENGSRRWLSTLGAAEFDRAVEVVDEAGFDRFGVLLVPGETSPASVDGFHRTTTTKIAVLPGVELEIVGYAR